MSATEEIRIRDRRGKNRYFIDNMFFRGGWAKAVGPYGIAIYNALVLHADIEDQSAWPSYQTLADLTGMSRRQVIREVKKLTDYNLIVVNTRMTDDGGFTSNEYILTHSDEWILPGGGDSQSTGGMTHSHRGDDSESLKQDSLNKTQLNNVPEAKKTASGVHSGASLLPPSFVDSPPVEEDFDQAFPRQEPPQNGSKKRLTAFDALMAGRVGESGKEVQAEQDLQSSGWEIRVRAVRQAMVLVLAYTRLAQVPASDGQRKRWFKALREMADEFSQDEMRRWLSEAEKVFTGKEFTPTGPEAYTKVMLGLRAAPQPEVKDFSTEGGVALPVGEDGDRWKIFGDIV